MKFIGKYLQTLFFTLITLFMITIFFIMFSKGENYTSPWKEERFDVTINGSVYTNIDVDSTTLPHLKRGDTVTIGRVMKNFDYKNDYLVFKSFSSTVEVYWNGWEIYSYGREKYENGDFLGRGYHIIKLDRVENKSPALTIKLKAGEKMHYDWLDFLKFTSSHNIWSDIFEQKLASVALSMTLFILGFIGFVCFGIVSLVLRSKSEHLLYSFSTAFFVGLWSSCVNGLFQKMTGSYELTGTFEYLSLYIIPYFYISLIELIKKKSDKYRFLSIIKKFYLAFVFFAAMLHIMGIIHVSQFASGFRVSIVFALVLIFLVSIKDYRTQRPYEKVLAIGNVLSATLIAVQSILLNLNIYSIRISNRIYELGDFFVSVPIVIVIIAPLISYSLSVREMKDQETQISLLKNLAYKDSLTGLYNRHRGMAFAIELMRNDDKYCVIMIDLNNLKIVNDTFGHDRGDKLLVDFSNCMRKAFNTKDFLNIRHGGDEFVVVSRFSEEEKIIEYLERLKSCIKSVNSKVADGCRISIAYGLAQSDEVENGDYDATLKLADERMYENKSKIKKMGGGGSII